MSFSTDINKPNKNKIVLVEIDIPVIQETWINYTSGIWYIRFVETQETMTDDQGQTYFYPANVSNIPSLVGSCLVDSEYYTEVSSIALCQSTNKSYYYDVTNSLFYIHFDSFEPLLNKIVRIGVVYGYCDRSDVYYYNGVYYDPRVTRVPSLSQKKDTIFFGIQQYQSGSVTFINSDGHFDGYNSLNIYGQPSRMKVGFDGYSYSDFEEIFEGFIEDYDFNFNDFTIKIQDKRKNLSRKFPNNQFNTNEFPYLNEDDIDKYKPIVFGKAFYYPAVCTNKDQTTPTNRTFMFLDTEYGSADSDNYGELRAYIKNDEDINIYDQINIASINVDNGTFNVARANVDNDENIPRDVFVIARGYEGTDTSFDSLQYLINNFSDITYNSVFFNTTELSSEFDDSNNESRQIGLWLKEPKTITEIITDLMFADDGFFYVQRDGLYSGKKFRTERLATETIQNYRWISDPDFSYNTGEFLSSVNIQGKLHYSKNQYLISPINTTYEQEVLYKYKKYVTKEFKTILIEESEILDKAENIMLQTKDIVRIVKRTGDMSLYDIDVMDIIITSVKRKNESEFLEEWQVIGKTFDLTNFTITLELQYWGEA